MTDSNAKTDQDFNLRMERWRAHMDRFKFAHDGQPNGAILIELERRERWASIMGDYAAVMPVPDV